MVCHEKIVLRVFLTEGDIRKVTLLEKPASVDDLIVCLKDILDLQYNFSLQFEDPDFGSALVNLTNMSELQNKATIRVIPMVDLIPLEACEVLDDSVSIADTVIISPSALDRHKQWPEKFEIPNFPVDIEYRLRQANLSHMNDGTCLKITKELKHGILEKLAETIFDFKAYPNDTEFEQVAAALITKHPCLMEKGSRTGWAGWKNSLKFKLGNYRTKRRKAGCPDVAVNGGKRSLNHPEGEPSRRNIKKPKKCELNFLPNIPEGQDYSSLEAARNVLLDEMQKRTPNASLVKQNMDLTFALRRKEVVESKPVIMDIVKRWPALFQENQIYMEFTRIAGKNLKQDFLNSLDQYSGRLMEVFRAKRGLAGQLMSHFLQQTNSLQPTEVRTLILRGLPVILGDDSPAFFKACSESDVHHAFDDVPVGIVIVEKDDVLQPPDSLHLHPFSVGIILEGNVVMNGLRDLPQAMCILFGLIYALHLNYPRPLRNTFEFIQRVLLCLGRNVLRPKIQSLLNQLV